MFGFPSLSQRSGEAKKHATLSHGVFTRCACQISSSLLSLVVAICVAQREYLWDTARTSAVSHGDRVTIFDDCERFSCDEILIVAVLKSRGLVEW